METENARLCVFKSTNVMHLLGVSLPFGQQVASYQVRSGVILAQRKNDTIHEHNLLNTEEEDLKM